MNFRSLLITSSILVCFFCYTAQSSQRWVGFAQQANTLPINVKVLESDISGLTVDLTLSGMQVTDIEAKGIIYQAIQIQGAGKTAEIGNPELPTVARYLAVPPGAKITTTILEQDSQLYDGYNIFPFQEPLPESVQFSSESPFRKNAQTYSSAGYFPSSTVEISNPIVIRGCQVVLVGMFPIRFDAANKQLEVTSHLQIRIDFKQGASQLISQRLRSPGFDAILQNLLLNPELTGATAPTNQVTTSTHDTVGTYLIIAHDNYLSAVQDFAQWKHKKGYFTQVVGVPSQVAQDSAAIKNYITNTYQNWDIPPDFVLLVGDADEIPPYYVPYYAPATDLYYGAIDGSDWFPDILVGRLPVDEASVDIVLSKIMDYERDPYLDETAWYNNFFAAAYFQDDNQDGTADRFFLQTAELLRRFMGAQGFDISTYVYTTNSWNPMRYYYGAPIPTDISFTPSPGTNEVLAAINAGTFWVQHRDHGFELGWGDPSFYKSDVANLTNGRMLPIMMSINCLSCRFDYSSDSFGETILKKENGGVVSIVGATKNSYSGFNDEFSKGFYDAVWTDFDPTYPGGGDVNPLPDPIYDLGGIFNFGKFWMYDKYLSTGGAGYPWTPSSTSTREEFEMFNLLGDPDLEPWTSVPEDVNVTFAESIDLEPTDVSVTVTTAAGPFEGALVCLMKDEETYASGLTDESGAITLHVEPTTDGTMDVTVTGHNIKPTEDSLQVIGSLSIAGHVEYWPIGNGVRQVNMNCSGDVTKSVNSDDSGSYLLDQLEKDSTYTVTPEKTGDIGTQTIVGYDASLALQIALGMLSPTAEQFMAADVDTSGAVLAQDAGHIARYAVGLPPLGNSIAGQWTFDPLSKTYNPLTVNMSNQDFTAILIGDVDGNWNPTTHKVSSPPLLISDHYQKEPGSAFIIPVNVNTGQDIFSIDIWMEYDPKILEFRAARSAEGSEAFTKVLNNTHPGSLRLSMFTATPLTGKGDILFLEFGVVGMPHQSCTLNLKQYQINDGPIGTAQAQFRVESELTELPKNYQLLQNHPNPFNPQTTIEFSLPESDAVTLKVYDLLGNEIITLVNTSYPAGNYKITWDGRDSRKARISSGVYVYTIRTTKFTDSKKLVITK